MLYSSSELEQMTDLAKYYVGKDIFVDTKPLLLYLIGSYSIRAIESEFSIKDFEFLRNFLGFYSKIVVTPQILAEVSNLANNRIEKKYFYDFIKNNVKILQAMREEYIPKDKYLQNSDACRIGLADISVVECCKEFRLLLLTNDSTLIRVCYENEIPVLSLTKLRAAAGLLS